MAMLAPLGVEDERAPLPSHPEGSPRDAASSHAATVDAARRRRELLRARQEGQEAESTLLRATFGLVRARVQ